MSNIPRGPSAKQVLQPYVIRIVNNGRHKSFRYGRDSIRIRTPRRAQPLRGKGRQNVSRESRSVFGLAGDYFSLSLHSRTHSLTLSTRPQTKKIIVPPSPPIPSSTLVPAPFNILLAHGPENPEGFRSATGLSPLCIMRGAVIFLKSSRSF